MMLFRMGRWAKPALIAGMLCVPVLYGQTAGTTVSTASTTVTLAQDPGPRNNNMCTSSQTSPCPDAGGFIGGNGFKAWAGGGQLFGAAFSVTGSIEPGAGLGPGFNGNSCEMCHANPAPGGSSPGEASVAVLGQFGPGTASPGPFGSVNSFAQNQQLVVATLDSATNSVPSFITANGPTREARFQFLADGQTPDNGVHNLFSIKGRTDASGCNFPQNTFTASDIIFRIPTPLFGLGLVENTPESELIHNLTVVDASKKSAAGIAGTFNHSGNDGTITRFGWKAQNKSLLVFAGEALNVEMGVTNELFPDERFDLANQNLQSSGATFTGFSGCSFVPTSEDIENITNSTILSPPFFATPQNPQPAGTPDNVLQQNGNISSIATQLAIFMRLNAPPTAHPDGYQTGPASNPTLTVTESQITSGQSLFTSTGCALCHSASLTTTISTASTPIASSSFTGLSNVTYAPFSDFALHNMGTASGALGDGITQGFATGSQFRTAPLWGAGQRLFFLHDGRAGFPGDTNPLMTAIEAHVAGTTATSTGCTAGTDSTSEAFSVIQTFCGLTPTQQQNILYFIRSL